MTALFPHATYTAPAYIRASVAEAVERLEPKRKRRLRHVAPSLALLRDYHLCPDCAAIDAANLARGKAFFDRMRDRALVRRDVNEALEVIVLEALGGVA